MTPKELYTKLLFQYGITTILMVLEHYERLEVYEECQAIVDAIRSEEERLGAKLWTRNTPEAIEEVIKTYKEMGLTGKHHLENSRVYANKIIDELNIKPCR